MFELRNLSHVFNISAFVFPNLLFELIRLTPDLPPQTHSPVFSKQRWWRTSPSENIHHYLQGTYSNWKTLKMLWIRMQLGKCHSVPPWITFEKLWMFLKHTVMPYLPRFLATWREWLEPGLECSQAVADTLDSCKHKVRSSSNLSGRDCEPMPCSVERLIGINKEGLSGEPLLCSLFLKARPDIEQCLPWPKGNC